MRVLWVTHFVPYPATGHGALQRTHHLLMRAAAQHEIGLLALDPKGEAGAPVAAEASTYFSPNLAFCDIHPLGRGHAAVRRRTAMVKAALGTRSYWERWFTESRALTTFRSRLRTFEPQVVHLDSVLLASYAKLASPTPLMVTHHNIESDLYGQRARVDGGVAGALLAREAAKVTRLERRFAPRAAMNVMVSEADAARLGELAPGARTTVVPNGVDVDFFRPITGTPVRERSLVFVGGMDWYPNRLAMEWLAEELWERLVSDDSARQVTVVGRQPPPSLLALSERDERVQVAGFVDDVRPYISAAAIYVCPIKVGGGTRLKILDALSMERPLVSTALGVSGLALVEGEHYLRAETAEEFSRQIARLEADASLREALGRRGRAVVEQRYSWDIAARALDDAFTAIRSLRRSAS
jgi:glycosyltransferase involved in cell wall biosynthesis